MTSRFFMSDSESESSSDSEEYTEKPTGIPAAYAFSDEEEDLKRVVRSEKEKRYEELNDIIKSIKNLKRNNDMASVLTKFEDLCKAYQKATNVIMREEGGKTPRFFVRCLVELEDYVNSHWEGRKENLSKAKVKSITTLRQKLKKYMRDFEDDVNEFRENPDEETDEEKEEKEDDEDDGEGDDVTDFMMGPDDFKKSSSVTKELSRADFDDGMDSDSDDEWPSDSEESSSSSEDERKYLTTRERFLKVRPEGEGEGEEGKPKKTKVRERKKRREREDSEEEGQEGWETVSKKSAVPMEKPKLAFSKDDEITVSLVVKKLHEIMAARGKKGTDRREQIELLHQLFNIAKENNLGQAMAIKIHFNIIMSIYDYNPSISDPMKVDFWEKILLKIEELLNMLVESPDIAVGDHITDETESLENSPLKVRGCVLTIVERMDEEFTKLLKACDAHSNEYVVRLKDEIKTCQIIDKLLKYEEEYGSPSDLCRIYLRKIEHIYYKYDKRAADQVKGIIPEDEETSLTEMDKLCKYIYVRDNTDRLRTRAVLCHIYHMSLHDKWYRARDLMLMAHLQETIQHSDLPTQILYNRTMVQLGLCAFRHGTIKDAHHALLDIQSGGRAKELLAQGLVPQRQLERTTEQEKQEKQRQIPFHQHINLEMLECVYLVSAMLIEIPYMAAHEFDARRRMISKSFHHQLKNSERQSLVGPPESMREHVVAASKAMRNGNWKQCSNLLLNPKMNAKVWDLFHDADTVRSMLGRKIQEESLRTYLFTYSHVYNSISLITLSEMFELPKSVIHAIISKMIINEEIMASLDEPSSCLVMHRTEPSSLQSLSLQLADKLYNLVDNNERVFDQKPFFTGASRGTGPGVGYRDRQKGNWNDRRDRDRRDGRRD